MKIWERHKGSLRFLLSHGRSGNWHTDSSRLMGANVTEKHDNSWTEIFLCSCWSILIRSSFKAGLVNTAAMAQWHRGHPTHLKYHHQSCSDEIVEAKTSPCSNLWCLEKDKQEKAVTRAEEFSCSIRKFAEADLNSMKTLVPPGVLCLLMYAHTHLCLY